MPWPTGTLARPWDARVYRFPRVVRRTCRLPPVVSKSHTYICGVTAAYSTSNHARKSTKRETHRSRGLQKKLLQNNAPVARGTAEAARRSRGLQKRAAENNFRCLDVLTKSGETLQNEVNKAQNEEKRTAKTKSLTTLNYTELHSTNSQLQKKIAVIADCREKKLSGPENGNRGKSKNLKRLSVKEVEISHVPGRSKYAMFQKSRPKPSTFTSCEACQKIAKF